MPIIRTAFSCKNVLRYFDKVQRKSNVCIIRFDWLISLHLFISLFHNTIILIVKTVVSGKNSMMSTNHCARSSCWWVCAFAPHLWFVHLPNWYLSLHLPPLQHPGMCMVDNFQRLRFGNSRSPDKFTGKLKTEINIYVYIYIVHHILGQWHISIYQKVFTFHW